MQSGHNSPINYNTQPTESLSVIARVSVTEPLADDTYDLYSVDLAQTSGPTLSVCPSIFFLTLSCKAFRATGTYSIYPGAMIGSKSLLHHRTSRESHKRKKKNSFSLTPVDSFALPINPDPFVFELKERSPKKIPKVAIKKTEEKRLRNLICLCLKVCMCKNNLCIRFMFKGLWKASVIPLF